MESGRAVVRVPAGGPAAHATRTSRYEWYEFLFYTRFIEEKLVPVVVRIWEAGGRWYEFRQGGLPPTQLVRVGTSGTSSHFPWESQRKNSYQWWYEFGKRAGGKTAIPQDWIPRPTRDPAPQGAAEQIGMLLSFLSSLKPIPVETRRQTFQTFRALQTCQNLQIQLVEPIAFETRRQTSQTFQTHIVTPACNTWVSNDDFEIRV